MDELRNLNTILGYCTYCHDPIYVGDSYVADKDGLCHDFCHGQKDRYYDPLEEDGR